MSLAAIDYTGDLEGRAGSAEASGVELFMAKNVFSLTALRTARRDSPAKQRLLDAVKELLESHSPSEITTAMVLETAGVARNTLYLHFENHSTLLESALLSMFLDGVEQHVSEVEMALQSAKSKTEFMQLISKMVKSSQGTDRKDFRIARCRLVAHADGSPSFLAVLSQEQTRINERFAACFVEMQRRGWMQPTFSPATAAVLVQALTLGRVVDDVAATKLTEDEWNSTFMAIIRNVILGN